MTTSGSSKMPHWTKCMVGASDKLGHPLQMISLIDLCLLGSSYVAELEWAVGEWGLSVIPSPATNALSQGQNKLTDLWCQSVWACDHREPQRERAAVLNAKRCYTRIQQQRTTWTIVLGKSEQAQFPTRGLLLIDTEFDKWIQWVLITHFIWGSSIKIQWEDLTKLPGQQHRRSILGKDARFCIDGLVHDLYSSVLSKHIAVFIY